MGVQNLEISLGDGRPRHVQFDGARERPTLDHPVCSADGRRIGVANCLRLWRSFLGIPRCGDALPGSYVIVRTRICRSRCPVTHNCPIACRANGNRHAADGYWRDRDSDAISRAQTIGSPAGRLRIWLFHLRHPLDLRNHHA